MPIDPSIALRLNPPPQINPVETYGNVLALQGGMQRNALLGLQTQAAQRSFADEEAVRGVLSQPGMTLQDAPNALLKSGQWKSALELQTKALDVKAKQATIGKDEADTNLKHLGVLSSALAPLVGRPNVTPDDIASVLMTARAAGVPDAVVQNIYSAVPQNAMLLPQFLRNVVGTTERGIAALKAYAPDVTMQDVGGSVVPMNKNPLAGPIGAIPNAAPIKKTNTPGELLTDERTRSEGAANRGVTMRGQNMTDARSREQIALGGRTYDAERGVVVNTRDNTAAPVTQGGQPLPGKLPESQKKELTSIDAQANTVDAAIRAVEKTPSAFSFPRGAATMAGPIAETVMGRRDSKDEREARSFVFNVVSKVINERAGAAQSVQELARLRAFLPAEADNAEQIKDKLASFKSYLSEQRTAYEQPVQPGPKPTNAQPRSADQERKSVGGKSYVKMNGQWYEDRRAAGN